MTIESLASIIRDAAARGTRLRIRGGGTKDFYGGRLEGEILDARSYSGIVDYEPAELVITARSGTPLADIEAAMRERRQMLAFEPPRFASGGTIGGAIAAGLSGPRRAYAGAARDFVLGVRLLDGKGNDLRFGGAVMKNVAGYDVSRLMAGALGTLGMVTEVSLKALPLPPMEITLRQERSQGEAIALINDWAGKPLPITATSHFANELRVRLSGAESAVRAARARLGGEELADNGADYWAQLRDHTFDFLKATPLWRLSVKPTTPPLELPGVQLIEWGGALRWLAGDYDAAVVRNTAARAGGHATLFRGGDKQAGVFQPLSAALMTVHRRLKDAFDPQGIFNRGRMYAEW
ncbi:MAG TPA: glycolate oxidase subunit GlcE [Burkholderiales bacterium]|nr:glycolate oxidase subunit GlcE [Burkholderiales bacterium]